MEIKNISGQDIISTNLNVNSEVSSKPVNNESEKKGDEKPQVEQSKGHSIDSYA